MNLNMTSIKDAWGVSDISERQLPTDRLNKSSTSSSSFFKHPNAITDSRPTRIDVALFDKDLITELFPHTPEYRTKIVTEKLTNTIRPSPKSLRKPPPPPPPSWVEEEEEETRTRRTPALKEYFQIPQMQQWDSRLDLTTILLLTFLLLLLDKISTIWKNS